ncbi:class Ia ribonucleoside-diphosphate reductase subunit beta [Reinekea marina]|uniref:ribonucleoside-diphosphate reductase n=1 Tax=Reinekea marina TaxID=1310421 RepID=A0ABV7WRN0_9GAMM|nr:class Ia ribonucleoside-diphosphate reductase subunit beta [Reinekea marina]MBU2864102.1 ribonucleotide-diphosphate reductase subunit beta [Reinekea forsetii]MDN3650980.1 class Ia ribonucleoside-diphosphate reductase subunit beta [Reinekea marina]
MSFLSFNQKQFNPLTQPMFMGESVNVARFDQQRYPMFEQLIEKQLSFFWRPEEVDLSQDRKDFLALSEHEKHIFLSNLKYQTLLDSVQGRSPNIAFLPIVSLPELETWIETWAFSETIHSRSYTHIIRNIVSDPSVIFDDIVNTPEIVERAESITDYYDQLIYAVQQWHLLAPNEQTSAKQREIKRLLYLTMVTVNVLEAIRFYVSFACSFAFAENAKMEGNAKVVKLIARDEALHLSGTEFIINTWAEGKDDPEMADIAKECQGELMGIFKDAADQEKAWANYLFAQGSMMGINADILHHYIEFLTDERLQALKQAPLFNRTDNPLPWMDHWVSSEAVQVAPQEVEISSYLVGAVNTEVNTNEFEAFEL